MAHEHGSASVLALSEGTEEWGKEDISERNEEDYYRWLGRDRIHLTGGIEGYQFWGGDKSYVYTHELFHKNGTLKDEYGAVYLENDYDNDIMRIEQDGSWTIVEGLDWYNDPRRYAHSAQKGRVQQKDLTQPLVWDDGRKDVPVLFFENGIGPYSFINSITMIPRIKREIGNRFHFEECDVEVRFREALLHSSLVPEI